MSDLAEKKCVPCEGNIPPFKLEEIHNYLKKVDGWSVKEDGMDGYHLTKDFKFENFLKSQDFVNKVGDRVTRASMPIGAYSEKQIIPEDKLVKVPDNISDEVASCITLKGITAEYLLHRTYQVKKGDKILYHAAAGALGQIFCPWANALGAEIIGTVGSDEKIEIAKKNGCHHVINYNEKNFVEEVEKIVGKNGLDVVYDGVGAKTFEGSIEVLKVRGMMVAFGNASGYVHTLDIKKTYKCKRSFFY